MRKVLVQDETPAKQHVTLHYQLIQIVYDQLNEKISNDETDF